MVEEHLIDAKRRIDRLAREMSNRESFFDFLSRYEQKHKSKFIDKYGNYNRKALLKEAGRIYKMNKSRLMNKEVDGILHPIFEHELNCVVGSIENGR